MSTASTNQIYTRQDISRHGLPRRFVYVVPSVYDPDYDREDRDSDDPAPESAQFRVSAYTALPQKNSQTTQILYGLSRLASKMENDESTRRASEAPDPLDDNYENLVEGFIECLSECIPPGCNVQLLEPGISASELGAYTLHTVSCVDPKPTTRVQKQKQIPIWIVPTVTVKGPDGSHIEFDLDEAPSFKSTYEDKAEPNFGDNAVSFKVAVYTNLDDNSLVTNIGKKESASIYGVGKIASGWTQKKDEHDTKRLQKQRYWPVEDYSASFATAVEQRALKSDLEILSRSESASMSATDPRVRPVIGQEIDTVASSWMAIVEAARVKAASKSARQHQ